MSLGGIWNLFKEGSNVSNVTDDKEDVEAGIWPGSDAEELSLQDGTGLILTA